jgi:two-component system, NarL family, sensor histidine kinase UhpB
MATTSDHSLPARLLLRRQLTAIEHERTAVAQLRARYEAERRAAGAAAIRAQEQEKQRLAQDLHDEVNQALTAILLRLEATIQEAPPALQEELRDTKRLAAQAMNELLRLARRLRPAVLDDHGLMPALHTQVRDFTEQTGIRATFHPQGAPTRLSAEQQLAIYRVTQEGLSNVAQHARATHVAVRLRRDGDATVLRIADDGHGFDPQRPAPGLGLTGMRERAGLAGGGLTVESAPGQGTTVELRLGER